MQKILFVASEAAPFVKTGGLGDVMGALPKTLVAKSYDARVIIPLYGSIRQEYKEKFEFVKWITVPVGWRESYCGIFKYEYCNTTFYFLDNEYYFKRDSLYGFFDDAERFAFFDRAVLMAIKAIDFKPDIIHCNDWQTGMIPVLYKLEYCKDPFYYNIKTVYSIHNLLFQGTYDPEILPELFGYDMEPYLNKSVELCGGVSFMKGGINYSDKITTVSSTYLEEIKTPHYGERLDGLLKAREHDLWGILNGIDYQEYNPRTDELIYKNYGIQTIKNKVQNKLEFQKEMVLPVNKDIPLIAIVSRLTPQKGMDLVANIADRLLQHNIQLVILGTGDRGYEDHFRNLEYRYRDKVRSCIQFDAALSHKIYASADMFVMPSQFEPCGLGQLIALRYGTIPIVRETGGLRDTITPYNQFTGEGNGFSFANYNAWELFQTIENALSCYYDKHVWNGLIKHAMQSNNSWEKAADMYINLYNSLY